MLFGEFVDPAYFLNSLNVFFSLTDVLIGLVIKPVFFSFSFGLHVI